MWNTIVEYLIFLFSSVLSWLTSIFNAIPGSWDTLFTIFVIFMIARYLLGPILGVAFSAGSDKAQKKDDE